MGRRRHRVVNPLTLPPGVIRFHVNMSACKSSVGFPQKVLVQARQTALSLSEDAVLIHRGGIEFRSPEPFQNWTEMTVSLRAPDNGAVNCAGVVVACSGNRHAGYHVSMVFTSLSRQAQARLAALAQSPLA